MRNLHTQQYVNQGFFPSLESKTNSQTRIRREEINHRREEVEQKKTGTKLSETWGLC
jgi:hypothetical protein